MRIVSTGTQPAEHQAKELILRAGRVPVPQARPPPTPPEARAGVAVRLARLARQGVQAPGPGRAAAQPVSSAELAGQVRLAAIQSWRRVTDIPITAQHFQDQ